MKQVIRAGGYAISSNVARPWITIPVEYKTDKNGKMYKPITLVNPIFKECASLTTDSLWHHVFNQASIGKFPKGFTYKDSKLTSRSKSKIKTIEISDDPYETFALCIEFFKLAGGLISETDQQRSKLEYDNIKVKEEDFVSILKHRKNQRDEYIKLFIDEEIKKNNLPSEEFINLNCLVEIGFFLNRFDFKDLIIDENKKCITGVNGLIYNENEKKYSISKDNTIKLTPRPLKRKTEKEGIIDLKWRKFLDDLDKKKKKVTFQNTLMASPNMLRYSNRISEKESP